MITYLAKKDFLFLLLKIVQAISKWSAKSDPAVLESFIWFRSTRKANVIRRGKMSSRWKSLTRWNFSFLVK